MTGKLDNLHPQLLDLLTKLEHRLGYQLTVTSGYRDAGHNQKVGGVSNSEHTYMPAQAVDVSCTNGRRRFEIVVAALEEGCVRVGIGKNFVHLGMASDKPQRVIWTYY